MNSDAFVKKIEAAWGEVQDVSDHFKAPATGIAIEIAPKTI